MSQTRKVRSRVLEAISHCDVMRDRSCREAVYKLQNTLDVEQSRALDDLLIAINSSSFNRGMVSGVIGAISSESRGPKARGEG